eukprot:212980-Prorocentrum_minimum.AAC.4
MARHEQAEVAAHAHQQEIAGLKEQLQTKTQEARELSHMLRAWEAMRAGKDQQIAQVGVCCYRMCLSVTRRPKQARSGFKAACYYLLATYFSALLSRLLVSFLIFVPTFTLDCACLFVAAGGAEQALRAGLGREGEGMLTCIRKVALTTGGQPWCSTLHAARSLEKIKQDASSRQAAARGGSSATTLAQRLFGPDTTSHKDTATSSQAATLKRDGPRVLQAKPTVVYSLKGIVPPPAKQY